MFFIAVDLGTTNIKVVLYDSHLTNLNVKSTKVDYQRQGEMVEFDAEEYFQVLIQTIKECCQGYAAADERFEIVLTGQAESLVMIGQDGQPARKAISWLDERSKEEVRELNQKISPETCYAVTGQVSIIPTWPFTKIMWVRKHEPDVFSKVFKYLLIKDYIQYRLTGKLVGEFSIYNFSLYLDIRNKTYWKEILDIAGVEIAQLPALVEPGTNIGLVSAEAAAAIGLSPDISVNVGTLDHFASMIGTGNIQQGIVSESTGTVLSVATLVDEKIAEIPMGIPCHYGPFENSYVLLSTCESGGISYEWYKEKFFEDKSFDEIGREVESRARPGGIIFLPYLTGVNAPDYDENAQGVFYGLKLKHDRYDLALAVMEGIAYMLANNLALYKKLGIELKKMISTGGGSRSRLWTQIKADVAGCDIVIPAEKESACLGAAIIGAVDAGIYASYEQAVEDKISFSDHIQSAQSEDYAKSHDLYNRLDSLLREHFWQSN